MHASSSARLLTDVAIISYGALCDAAGNRSQQQHIPLYCSERASCSLALLELIPHFQEGYVEQN